MALHICLQMNMPELLWGWVQKSKARSLSDSLGVNLTIPQALEHEILEDAKTKELSEKEAALLVAIKERESGDRLVLRGELFALQKQMRAHHLLKAVLDLREGRAVNLADVRNLKPLNNASDQLIFADWFFTNGYCYVCTVKGGETPIISNCNIMENSVEAWKIKYMDTKGGRQQSLESSDFEEENPEYPLRQLDSLVAPLSDLVNENDTVVCSVTGALHSIPMHALWIDDEPLIVKNPVVYCASITTFVQCWDREVSHNAELMQKTFMAVFEPSSKVDFSSAEQRRIYEETETLAKNFKAISVIGKASNRIRLEEVIQKSSLFHFHGHCLFDEAAIMDQALVLADGAMSIKEIFRMRLASPHITLIACDSASQAISRGDEPLGIVTALLCASASSVLGTIWPTASGTGRNLSSHFYAELGKCQSKTVFDLARALQHAVIEIRDTRRTRQPYHWASFVLHGAPFMRYG